MPYVTNCLDAISKIQNRLRKCNTFERPDQTAGPCRIHTVCTGHPNRRLRNRRPGRILPTEGRKHLPGVLTIAAALLVTLTRSPLPVHAQAPAEQLIADLGCPSCHPGFDVRTNLRDKTPDLSWAGLQYNPAYLFSYLQSPTRVRRHIGDSRMPGFRLSERERLALTLFLQSQRFQDPGWPDFPATRRKGQKLNLGEVERLLTADLQCTKCHTLNGAGSNASIDLNSVGYRLNLRWLQNYLISPQLIDGPHTTMPGYFYRVVDSRFVELLPGAREMVSDISAYLFRLGEDFRTKLEVQFKRAQEAYPEVTPQMGERMFRSQNCTACHNHRAIDRPLANAPDLRAEGDRVGRQWLTAYLKKPTPIRPFGFYPGSGSRMPDFGLTDEEVDLLADYLMNRHRIAARHTPFNTRELSAFSMEKAETFLRSKLSCLGCHRLGGEGGRIGPDLSSLSSRLQPDFVYQFVVDPQTLQPQTIMPKIVMPRNQLELIVNYLLQQNLPRTDADDLSPLDYPVQFAAADSTAELRYLRFCSPCHGANGDGSGYNARYLPKPPTNFADKTYMSQRPDDTLFDGIFAGGYILNKSHLMPPWGHTFETSEIRQLVSFLRRFCDCQGPAWSRDNQ